MSKNHPIEFVSLLTASAVVWLWFASLALLAAVGHHLALLISQAGALRTWRTRPGVRLHYTLYVSNDVN